jgi:hypothetical protein
MDMCLDEGLGTTDYEKHGETLAKFFLGALTFAIVDSVAIALLEIATSLLAPFEHYHCHF